MSGVEVLGCVAAVVSAFQSASELAQDIKERRDKKKRRKEKDIEEGIELKLLHKSLVEGANQCRNTSTDRHQRYGPAFDVGDAIATSALKDVMISLQTEVIQLLQLARAVENAPLELTSLHEASITNRKDATRAIDELCQRIISRMPAHGQYGDAHYDMRGLGPPNAPFAFPKLRRMHSSDSSESLPANARFVGSPTNDHHQPSFQRMQSTHHGGDNMVQRGMSQASHGFSPYSWASSPRRGRFENDAFAFRGSSVQEDEENESRKVRDFPGSDHGRYQSFQDSVVGSDIGSRHKPAGSINSVAASDQLRTSSISDHSTTDQKKDVSTETLPAKPAPSITSRKSKPTNKDDDLTPGSSAASSVSSPTASPATAKVETLDDITRANFAPEVVTKEFESLLSNKNARPSLHAKRPNHSTNVHPAFRDQYPEPAMSPSPEPDHPWSPMPRPARHNNYHGFCKGAWQIRKSVHEGLSIRMIPNVNGVNVPHWTCKLCEFRSKPQSVNNPNVLPDQVFFHARTNIRYRWLFLAKSHVGSTVSYNKPESYNYGCIFCAAEGRTTTVHEKLDSLMIHILSKHKTSMMTPETKDKTGCVVGGVADRGDEWDINLPQTKPRSAGGAVSEFVVSAVTGLSKYG